MFSTHQSVFLQLKLKPQQILGDFFKLCLFRAKTETQIIRHLYHVKRLFVPPPQRNNSYTNMSSSSFRFTDYDCIGFDLDNTLARYKVGAMIEMEYNLMARFLIRTKNFSPKHLLQPFDQNFILKGLIVDDENGNLLRIAPDGRILRAAHGTRILTDPEIDRYYTNRHWTPADMFAKDPLVTWNGPLSEKMRTLLDYFDIAASLIFARAVDSIDEQTTTTQQAKYFVWSNILEALQDMFNREHFALDKGGYFSEMKSKPDKYYYKCSEDLLQWLKQLKKRGKLLFLLTGAHADFASLTATSTLGPDWRDYFDIVVCYAKKPGFFTMNRHFHGLDVDNNETDQAIRFTDIELGGIYTHGNWSDLHRFLISKITNDNQNPKFLYIGDNLVQDIYTPNVHSHCDTVAVCEELEAEGVDGHQQWHPDQQFLISTVWGSYFHCCENNMNDYTKITNWYHIMKTHSKLCVPNLEYVANLPIDQEYQCN